MGSVSLKEIPGYGVLMRFGWFQIDSSHIFYTSSTRHTAGIVNINPNVHGHVLITLQRVSTLLSDLVKEEYQDI